MPERNWNGRKGRRRCRRRCLRQYRLYKTEALWMERFFLWKSERNGDIILEVETLFEGRKFDYGVGYYYSS